MKIDLAKAHEVYVRLENPMSYQISIETIGSRFVNFVISPWDLVVT